MRLFAISTGIAIVLVLLAFVVLDAIGKELMDYQDPFTN